MSADAASRPDPSLSGVGLTGVALTLRRPGLLLTWTLFALGPAAAVIAGVRWLTVAFPFSVPVLMFVGVILMRLVGDVLLCAAYRAVLKPEQAGWGHIRLGGAEGRVMMMAFTRNPPGVPLEVFFGVMGAVAALVGLGALVTATVGLVAGASLFVLAFLVFLISIEVASVRASLVRVAGFIGVPEPLDAGWRRGEGRTLAMVGNALAATAFRLTLGALIVGLWWQTTSVWMALSTLWAPELPADPVGWVRLAAEIGLTALAASLVLALFTAIGAPVAAETWRRLGGTLVLQERRRLFEGP